MTEADLTYKVETWEEGLGRARADPGNASLPLLLLPRVQAAFLTHVLTGAVTPDSNKIPYRAAIPNLFCCLLLISPREYRPPK